MSQVFTISFYVAISLTLPAFERSIQPPGIAEAGMHQTESVTIQNFGAHMGSPSVMLRGGKGIMQDFREFALRGSMMDMAIGIIMGVAFSKIVGSLVDDIIMPPIGLLLGHTNAPDLFISLNRQHYASLAAARAVGAPTLNYGLFLNNIFNFLLVAFAVFLLVRQMNRLRRMLTSAPASPTTKTCPFCCSEIPVKATRCGACTSELEASAAASVS
jgi:large conductance mechanosensitive channel